MVLDPAQNQSIYEKMFSDMKNHVFYPKNTILPSHNIDSTMKNGIKLGNTASMLPVNVACLHIYTHRDI